MKIIFLKKKIEQIPRSCPHKKKREKKERAQIPLASFCQLIFRVTYLFILINDFMTGNISSKTRDATFEMKFIFITK